MSGRRAYFLLVCAVLGCRSHAEVCRGSECVDAVGGAGVDAGDAADAGQSSDSGSAAGGAAGQFSGGDGESGAAGRSEGGGGARTDGCGSDDDCDDGSVCNGHEACADGVCEAGQAPSCEHGTQCSEGSASEPCTYAHASPWLLLLTEERILGLPTAELGRRELRVLGEREAANVESYFDAVQWSPDGRRAFATFETSAGQALLELAFGAGVPGALQKPRNLPDLGSFSALSFAKDGSRAILKDESSGSYLLELGQSPSETSILDYSFEDRFSELEIAFCHDSKTWIDLWKQPPVRVTSSAAGVTSTVISGDEANVSPDGELVFVSHDDARVVSCTGATGPVTLGFFAEEASWSPRSTHVVTFDGHAARLLSVEDPLAPQELWSSPDASPFGWSPDGTKLVVELWNEDDETLTLSYVDVQSGSPVARHDLLEEPYISAHSCGNSGCVVWRERETDEGDLIDDLLYVPFDELASEHLLLEGGHDWALLWVDCDRGSAVIERALASSAHEVVLLRFDDATSSEQQLFESTADYGEVTIASDASGIAILTETDGEVKNDWVRMPAEGEDAVSIPLGFGYVTTFQPWP